MIEAHRCDRIGMSRKYLQRFTLSRQLFKPTEPNQKLHYLLQRPKHGPFHQILQRQEGLNLDYNSNKKQNWCDQEGFSPRCAID